MKLNLVLTTFYEGSVEDSSSMHLKIDVDGEACPDCLKIDIANLVIKQLGATITHSDNPFHWVKDQPS
ncbi:MAG TPA: hypothetical protein VEQ38_25555 [Verrucomicrobiae bacterium]|nr:hypothetical protein [Verrucomicrobiae bacterium]